jgi:tripartite-type tricarboxylate transporter receptor subunit TctC
MNKFSLSVCGFGRTAITTALLVLVPISSAFGADFPKQPVEITVLFGGPVATVAQILAEGVSKQIGVPVVAVSRTGGGGAVGYSYVQSTPADGYNVVFNSNSISTSYYAGNTPFDYKAFDPVAQVGMEVPALAVRSESGWKSLKDFAAAGKKQKMKVGISGRGSFTHLASAALFDKLGIEVLYVPYGTGSATVELLGGRVDAALQWPAQFKAQADAGQLNVLAVTGTARIPLMPNVPTAKEQGYDVDVVMWRGITVPKGTPKEVVAILESAIKKTVATPEFQQRTAALGMETAFLPAAEFGKVIASDDATIDKLMLEHGLSKKK